MLVAEIDCLWTLAAIENPRGKPNRSPVRTGASIGVPGYVVGRRAQICGDEGKLYAENL